MKFISGWFTLLLVITFTLGWAEFGICWLACMGTFPPGCFVPLLLICLTANMLISLVWMLATQEKIDGAEQKRLQKKKDRLTRKRYG